MLSAVLVRATLNRSMRSSSLPVAAVYADL